ncbi:MULTISPECIES: hypothetical protein [Nonomuraea]|uniref:hypothetical protein n=1 Tax=Nonomuraea TaxID=83681 RepID=UPI001C5FA095|nr:hypothetical protein [Nonomuraea ceibae]
MWHGLWTVVDESDRDQWDYAPLERVGPLRFGMSLQEAIVAMETQGYTSEAVYQVGKVGPFEQLRTQFRAVDAPMYREEAPGIPRVDIEGYYVGPMGLTCVTVDALSGPQVSFDGIRLVGRPPSELSAELSTYLEKTGREVRITPDGDIGSEELGVYPRPQRAGDVLLTRLVFGRPNDWANTMYDCIPADEWRVH